MVDAGYNRIEGRNGDVGDVEYNSVRHVAGYLTPVPGGVGPMTIALLLRNTLYGAAPEGPLRPAQPALLIVSERASTNFCSISRISIPSIVERQSIHTSQT